jgi:hypothetical protein
MQENIKQLYTEGLEEIRKNRTSGTDRLVGGCGQETQKPKAHIRKLKLGQPGYKIFEDVDFENDILPS